jgi:hypothetical protein
MKSAVAYVCSVAVGLAACLMVVIAQPKPYRPMGPDPDADSPIVQIEAGVQHCQARNDVIYKKIDSHTMTFHMELTTLCNGIANKTYISRQATVDVAKDPSGEVGAALVVAMANELIVEAGKDGFETTAKNLLEHTNLVAEPSPTP